MKANLNGKRVAMPALEEISEGRHDPAKGARKGKQVDFAEAA